MPTVVSNVMKILSASGVDESKSMTNSATEARCAFTTAYSFATLSTISVSMTPF